MKTIYVDTTDLVRSKRKTYLTEDLVAAGSTLRVQSIIGFESLNTSSGQVVCIGEIGNERSEIRRTSQNTGPSSSYQEVTLRDTLLFDHPQDTKVYIIDWDRMEVQWAATVNGTKATVAAYPFNIPADMPEMLYVDTSATSGYFFSRFNNTINSVNSDWSDPVPFGGFDDNTVFMIKKRALDDLNEEIDGRITHEFLNQVLWEARREFHDSEGKRPFRRNFNSDIGNVSTGMYRVDLPTTVERPYTSENIYGVRIGSNPNMRYYDKKEWDFDFRGINHSTLDHAYVADTSTSIWLANGRDFSDSATINIEGQNISVTRIAGLTGDSYYNTFRIYAHPDNAYDVASDSDAWENASFGLPDKFTVWADPEGSAYIYFNRPIDTAYVGQNIYADFYRRIVGYDSDADALDEPSYDMFVYFLKAKIKERRAKGNFELDKDADYKVWLLKKQEQLSKERLATDINLIPGVEHLPIPE